LGHPASQVVGGITDGVQTGIPRSLAASEMGGLGNHSATEDADSNRVRGHFHELSIMAKKGIIKQFLYSRFTTFAIDRSPDKISKNNHSKTKPVMTRHIRDHVTRYKTLILGVQ